MSDFLDPTPEPTPTPSPEPTPTPEPTPPPTEDLPEFLRSFAELDPEIKDSPQMFKDFKDINGLAKSYLHAKKFVGKDKISVPDDYTDQEGWNNIWNKLGRPETIDKYEIKAPSEKIDEEFLTKFKEEAFNAGLLPSQAQKITDFYEKIVSDKLASMETNSSLEFEKNQKELKEEWGDAFDSKLGKVKWLLNEHGGEGIVDHLKSLGVAGDAKTMKLFAKVAEALSGDNMPGIHQTNGGPLTPQDAMKKMEEIRGDNKHPFRNESHPAHEMALREMEQLAKFAYQN